jgi:hypothetical protein
VRFRYLPSGISAQLARQQARKTARRNRLGCSATTPSAGDGLTESWDDGEAVDLLPGKYDTFFHQGDNWVERFLRDKSGNVTGILYTQTDGEFEAKRIE